ncbi:MAG: BON domain-containing protein [Vicinamibacterales bacterium]|nr:BON domain-containing protein [Vicinamibacterales bacterium]
MSISRWLILTTLVGAVVAGQACTQKAADDTKGGIDKALDATKDAGEKTVDKTKEVVAATGEAITDGWITTKISTKFVDESLLKGSKINVDTNDHVVTLKGTVGSDAGKARATVIAHDTEGVTRVNNQLVVT